MRRGPLVALTLTAFVLRCYDLGAVTLRWDEGWSIALARLGVAEMARITRLDVHPPLYYLALKLWLMAAGAPELWLRFPSVLAATAAVPLAAAAAAAWWGPERRPARLAGLFAAAYTVVAPALVYYAGVTRMYALAVPLLLAAAYGLARFAQAGGTRNAAVAWVGATAALFTFYYTGFALAGLFAAALVAWPRAGRRILCLALGVSLAFLPWLAWVGPSLAARAAAAPAGGASPALVLSLLDDGLNGALFVAEESRWWSVLTLAIMVVGALLAQPRRAERLLVVVLPVLAALAGAAAGAGAHMFAPRYVLVATPFLALGIGRGLGGLWQRSPGAGALAGAAVLATVLPVLTGYTYQRRAEVTEAFDPSADAQALAGHTAPGDVVAFNILSLAGLYDRYRNAAAPPWTYAQLWDPVHEPLGEAISRLRRAAAAHGRLWLVLYRGTVSPDSAAAKAWADDALFPAGGWWRDGTLYQAYVAGPPGRPVVTSPADFGHGVRLVAAQLPPSVRAGCGLGAALTWQASGVPDASARVFVHAYAPDGTLVAQHDGYPAADGRPQTTWQAGETVSDRHGLWLPPATQGPLSVKLGLYDPKTGVRWRLAGGADSLTLGEVPVEAAASGDTASPCGLTVPADGR